MKRRRLVEAENARLRDENARMARRIAELEEREVVLTADVQAMQLRAALAESKDRTHGMCRDLATCVATCSAADHWRNQQREAS